MKKVTLIKLSTGEELIGELVSETESSITIDNIAQIFTTEVTENGCKYGMIPFAPYRSETELTFNKTTVVYSAEPSDDFNKSYMKMFSSIHLPDSEGLVTLDNLKK